MNKTKGKVYEWYCGRVLLIYVAALLNFKPKLRGEQKFVKGLLEKFSTKFGAANVNFVGNRTIKSCWDHSKICGYCAKSIINSQIHRQFIHRKKNLATLVRAFITESSSPEARWRRNTKTKKKSHTKKRKKFRSFFFFYLPTKHKIRRWADTERKHRRTSPISHSHTHTRASLPASRLLYSLIVVFAEARAEEMLSLKKIFVFQFCFESRTVQSRFPSLPVPEKL